jgi:hypothetical protein
MEDLAEWGNRITLDSLNMVGYYNCERSGKVENKTRWKIILDKA